jgi:hypothetical protein
MLSILLFIASILVILWLVGLVTSFIAGPILWVLLVIGIIFFVIWVVQRGRIVRS